MATGDGEPNLTREQVLERIAEAIGGDSSAYAQYLKTSIWLRVDKSREPSLLESRFGGPAMMPADAEWPVYVGEPYMGRDPDAEPDSFVIWYARQQKLPMWLIAQLNLAELPTETPLPREGLLSFFTDPFDGVSGHKKSDQQGIRITYTPPEGFGELVPHEKPEVPDHPGAFATWRWPHLRIAYDVKWSFSDWDAVTKLNEQAADAQPYKDIEERVSEAMHQLMGCRFGHFLLDAGMNHQWDPRHSTAERFDDIQPPPTLEERGYEPTHDEYQAYQQQIAEKADNWTTLLSIRRDGDLNPIVSDGLSFLIRKSDLAARRFDRPWIVRS